MTHMQTRVASRQWAAEVLSDALVTPAAGDPSGRYVGAEWFRAVFVRYSIGVDEWGDIIPGKGLCELRFDTFTVDRVTPKGVWLKGYHRLDGSVHGLPRRAYHFGDVKLFPRATRVRIAAPLTQLSTW